MGNIFLHPKFQAISNLLREELAKVTDAAEAERRGALLKKLRQAERRSGGLCNPAQLQREASTSSINSSEHLSDAMGSPTAVAPVVDSPSRGLSSWGTGMSALASAAAAGAPVVSGTSGFLGNHALSGGGGSLVGSPTESLKRQADVPWADNMLSAANRTRYGAMLKKRGRDLAKRMSVIMPAAAAEVQAVAVRLPLLEDDVEGEAAPVRVYRGGQSCGTRIARSLSRYGQIVVHAC